MVDTAVWIFLNWNTCCTQDSNPGLQHDLHVPQTTALPLTLALPLKIQYLNNDISDRIYEKKTQNWRAFITTLNQKTGTSKLYKTLKSITQSNTEITTSPAAIGASNSIPTYKAEANILIDHYANSSHMKPVQSDRHIIRRRISYRIEDTLREL